MEDQLWKNEYKQWKSLKPSQIKLLEEGANSLSQSWLLNEMWCDWNQLKKLKETELPRPNSKKYYDDSDPWFN